MAQHYFFAYRQAYACPGIFCLEMEDAGISEYQLMVLRRYPYSVSATPKSAVALFFFALIWILGAFLTSVFQRVWDQDSGITAIHACFMGHQYRQFITGHLRPRHGLWLNAYCKSLCLLVSLKSTWVKLDRGHPPVNKPEVCDKLLHTACRLNAIKPIKSFASLPSLSL